MQSYKAELVNYRLPKYMTYTAYISNGGEQSTPCPPECLVNWIDTAYSLLEDNDVVYRLF